jgi:hypothetical protein
LDPIPFVVFVPPNCGIVVAVFHFYAFILRLNSYILFFPQNNVYLAKLFQQPVVLVG